MPYRVSFRPPRQSPPARGGVTLLELLVALALVGGMLALVAPALRRPPSRDGQLETVLRAARSAAIARAQTLTISVDGHGNWSVRPLPPGDSVEVLGGTLDTPPSVSFELQLSTMGACTPATVVPPELAGWDAASCVAASRERDGT
ncbi:MAG: prepilin-type N-terminal cleavage/methylation domain-containing protein [Gemmatimonadaceae bacterium]|nr:prepilin-type N-terminal cleavage/methylation domain-containing protein [Gemmatimonadaceae bacterium]